MERQQVMEVLETEAARGWRDPELTAIFLGIVKNHPEDINVPLASHDNLGLSLFSEIRSTGALDWDHRPYQ